MEDPVSKHPDASPWTAVCIGEWGAAHVRSEIEEMGLGLSKLLLTGEVLTGGCYSALVPWGSAWNGIAAPTCGGIGRPGMSGVSARAPADQIIAEYVARLGEGGTVVVESSLEKRADREPSSWASECAFYDSEVYRLPNTQEVAAVH